MQPLTGNDLFQLYMESATMPMHTLKVLILDPADTDGTRGDDPDPTTMEGLRDWVERATCAIPPLHWRIVTAPLRLGASAWVEQHALDLDAHLRCTRIAEPGGREQLADVLNTLMEGRLDRDRPLWELWLVEGLEGGRVAHVWKLHHAIADGGASARILDRVYQHTSAERAKGESREVPSPATPPFKLARVALARRGRMTKSLPMLIRRSRAAKRVSTTRRRLGLPTGAKAMAGPMTRYNRGLTTHRTVAWSGLKMADIHVVRAAFDCTVNDVYMTVVAGALRRHFERVGELPAGPLTASVPVGLRQPSQDDLYANRMGVWYLTLATHVADPVERLHATRMITKGAREAAEVGGGPELLAEWQAYASIFKPMNRLGMVSSRRTHRPLFNVTVSNVRGPAKLLYADGVPVIDLFSLSVLSAGQGLNLTGWSYRDWFGVGIVACPEDEPDLWALADELPAALDELVQAARDRLKRINDYVGLNAQANPQ